MIFKLFKATNNTWLKINNELRQNFCTNKISKNYYMWASYVNKKWCTPTRKIDQGQKIDDSQYK